MRPLFALLCLSACTPKILETPDRAGCSLVVTDDDDGDGEVDRTTTTVYDSEGRWTRSDTERRDGSSFSIRTYDAAGCLSYSEDASRFDGGESNTSTVDTTCDANGDALTSHAVYDAQGVNPFRQVTNTVWERIYGPNGLTSTATEIVDYPDFGFTTTNELSFQYDELDRVLIRSSMGEYYTRVTSQTWWDDLKSDSLLRGVEVRGAAGELVSGNYSTYDERGRRLELIQVDDQGFETLYTTSWEDKRWADTAIRYSAGESEASAVVTCNEDTPYTERVQEWDGWSAEVDGTPDFIRIETWNCPE